ncbi:protein MCM10 homolog [Lingula anatina]|uniref:Protein MCM10 homolog n=1 Tax=Lingula anatina TaxID=7574 RepID=A0A1S3H5N6_LINAN|nr:protein MCM10 homolog [Lingula anatina]|eukprot:XP_013381323.1 protein MCM10 homolog [Lingula anatina]
MCMSDTLLIQEKPKAYEKKCRQKNEGTYFYGGQTYTTASHDLISTPSAGALNFVKHLEKKDGIEARAKAEKQNKPIISITPKQLLQQTQREHAERMKRQKTLSGTTGVPQQHVNPLDCVPQLGKGLGGDKGEIFLEDSPLQRPLSARRNDSVAAAKKKAVAKVQAKGGLERQDPNAIKKKKSPETLEAKRKRFAMEEATKETGSGQNGNSTEPPKKRSRLLGDLDPNSEEFKRLLNAKSSHSGAVSEIEMEQQEKYFGELEKREKYEDKMSNTLEVKCSVVVCKQCKYMAQSAADRCKEEGHTLVRKEAMKKFFKCVPCGKRTIAFGMLPTKNCSGCGEFKYEKTSMWKEKKGPLLDSEKLLLRGVEEKFLR